MISITICDKSCHVWFIVSCQNLQNCHQFWSRWWENKNMRYEKWKCNAFSILTLKAALGAITISKNRCLGNGQMVILIERLANTTSLSFQSARLACRSTASRALHVKLARQLKILWSPHACIQHFLIDHCSPLVSSALKGCKEQNLYPTTPLQSMIAMPRVKQWFKK